jgi:hypothetical protein
MQEDIFIHIASGESCIDLSFRIAVLSVYPRGFMRIDF